jgi:hypothetical protein
MLSASEGESRSSGGFVVIALWMIHLSGAMLFDFRHYIRDRFFLVSAALLIFLIGAAALSTPHTNYGVGTE